MAIRGGSAFSSARMGVVAATASAGSGVVLARSRPVSAGTPQPRKAHASPCSRSRTAGRSEPCLARPVPFRRYGFLPPPLTWPRVFAACCPAGPQVAGSVFLRVPRGAILLPVMADGGWRGNSAVYVGAFCGSEEEGCQAPFQGCAEAGYRASGERSYSSMTCLAAYLVSGYRLRREGAGRSGLKRSRAEWTEFAVPRRSGRCDRGSWHGILATAAFPERPFPGTERLRSADVVPSRPVSALLSVFRCGRAPRATGQDP